MLPGLPWDASTVTLSQVSLFPPRVSPGWGGERGVPKPSLTLESSVLCQDFNQPPQPERGFQRNSMAFCTMSNTRAGASLAALVWGSDLSTALHCLSSASVAMATWQHPLPRLSALGLSDCLALWTLCPAPVQLCSVGEAIFYIHIFYRCSEMRTICQCACQLFITVTKTGDKNNLKKEAFVWAHSFRWLSICSLGLLHLDGMDITVAAARGRGREIGSNTGKGQGQEALRPCPQ